jgi:hypothetical protein
VTAFLVIASATLDVSIAFGDIVTTDWQAPAFAYAVSAVLAALIAVVTVVAAIDLLVASRRRAAKTPGRWPAAAALGRLKLRR